MDIEEIEEMAEETTAEAPPAAEETPEERDKRLKSEDWERRDAAAWVERERIMGAPQPRDPEAAKRQRCCF